MPTTPRISFLSLFVPDLKQTALAYEAVLGVAPTTGEHAAPSPHPFAGRGPVVFQLGEVSLALYQCDQRTTHPGDVGIGLEASPGALAAKVPGQGGQVFYGPQPAEGDGRDLSIFVMPSRHFFEVAAPRRPR